METTEMYPYPVEVRQANIDDKWQWEGKIEEIGIIAYGPSKQEVVKACMDLYKQWIKRNENDGVKDEEWR